MFNVKANKQHGIDMEKGIGYLVVTINGNPGKKKIVRFLNAEQTKEINDKLAKMGERK